MPPGRSKLTQIRKRDEKLKILDEKRDVAMKSIGLLSRKLFKTGAVIEKDLTLLRDEALDVFFEKHDIFFAGLDKIIDIVSNFDQNIVTLVSQSFSTDLNQGELDCSCARLGSK